MKRIRATLGRLVDAEDRELLGRYLVYVSAFSVTTITVTTILGSAVRIFGLVAGT